MFEAGSAQGFPLSGDHDQEDNDVPMSEEKKHGDNDDDHDDEDHEEHDDEEHDDEEHDDEEHDDEDEDDDGQGSDGDIDMEKEVRKSNRTSDDTPDTLSDFNYENYGKKMVAKRSKV
jgi:hypothetical protein